MKNKRRIVWLTLLVGATLFATLAFVTGRPRLFERKPDSTLARPVTSYLPSTTKSGTRERNLSLQPEAFKMSRRLGTRFRTDKREKSALHGMLTIGSDVRNVQMSRTQTDKGEQVEITVARNPGRLTWEAETGALSSASRATGKDRELIERLVLDSPDQFVLAQLRGAGYYLIARAVRPEGADDNYRGALWDIVRIDDPERDPERRPTSPWHLYYINTRTGLVEKVISDFQGQRISAEINSWADVNGEKVPAQITWTQEGKTLMQFTLTNFSHAQL
jgi:hypothetical protein